MREELAVVNLDTKIRLWDIFLSTLRWGIGLGLGTCAGILLAVIGNMFRRQWDYLSLFFDFLRAIPILGLVPLIQITIGIHEFGKWLLIGWGATFPVWIYVENTLRRDVVELEVVLSCYALNPRERFRVYVWPRLLAGVNDGVRVSIGIAWLCVVAAELIANFQGGFWSGGLGVVLMDANNLSNNFDIYLALGTFGVLGLLSTKLWSVLTKLVFERTAGFNPLKWVKHG